MTGGEAERIAVGERLAIPADTSAALYGSEGIVVSVTEMPGGWTCVGIAIDAEDEPDPWFFDADTLKTAGECDGGA